MLLRSLCGTRGGGRPACALRGAGRAPRCLSAGLADTGDVTAPAESASSCLSSPDLHLPGDAQPGSDHPQVRGCPPSPWVPGARRTLCPPADPRPQRTRNPLGSAPFPEHRLGLPLPWLRSGARGWRVCPAPRPPTCFPPGPGLCQLLCPTRSGIPNRHLLESLSLSRLGKPRVEHVLSLGSGRLGGWRAWP